MPPDLVIPQDTELFRSLDAAAREKRCVFVAGLPGVGKSLLVQQLALIAAAAGRSLHLLQWDIARHPFDTPAILARYREVDGVTHPAIRAAVGLWARDAVRRWHLAHPDERHLLIGETPLVGDRLMILARPLADGIEPLLAGERTLFLIAAPTGAVRVAVEASRSRDMSEPRHERERASAPPHLVLGGWTELADVARRMGVAPNAATSGYDDAVYVAVYRWVLRHRRVAVLPITTVLPVRGSAHETPSRASELIPTSDDVARFIAQVNGRTPAEIERDAARWYDV